MSLGNQLSGVRLVDEGLRARFKAGEGMTWEPETIMREKYPHLFETQG